MAGGSGSGSNRKRRALRRRRSRKPNPAAQLADDLLVEILARVPYRDLCRFRCVSTRWRALISDPDNRGRLPQTLAGFFYSGPAPGGSFTGVPGPGGAPPLIHLSLSFLPDREREHLVLVGSCNGLLLGRCFRFPEEDEFDYRVVNPTTEEWVAVPIPRRQSLLVKMVSLGFDPLFSSHFHVFEFQVDVRGSGSDDHCGYAYVPVVKIYSSATGVWSHKQTGLNLEILPRCDSSGVFVNGVMYFFSANGFIGAVDVEGKAWRIDFPCSGVLSFRLFYRGPAGFIHLSQGRLHLAIGDDDLNDKLEIWALEDKDSEE
ncbi:unnamed protein product [Urochloa humidicola]